MVHRLRSDHVSAYLRIGTKALTTISALQLGNTQSSLSLPHSANIFHRLESLQKTLLHYLLKTLSAVNESDPVDLPCFAPVPA